LILVYDDLKRSSGKNSPQEDIAFIHDANTETRKAELFAKVRSGPVRTSWAARRKGRCTNVQDRLMVHDLDLPVGPLRYGQAWADVRQAT
jgi:hypothetical protein